MIIKKYKLYETESEWDDKVSALEAHLGIPTEDTLNYAVIESVSNPNHPDFGKFIMPVTRFGPWTCDDQFSGELEEFDPSWFSDQVP